MENELNRKMAKLVLEIRSKQKQIKELGRKVSKNMLHRNRLIKQL